MAMDVQAYRLADYLDQVGRALRHGPVPKLFWTAAVRHCHGEAAETLGDAAYARGLLHTAHLLAVSADTPRTQLNAADRLANAGRLDEALPWYQRAANRGRTGALVLAAQRLRKVGRLKEAEAWRRQAAASTSDCEDVGGAALGA
ncbi:hypothetical protein ACFO9E_00075 [Streptomyces maoxianensis]|uniref:Tetratricopeptide repeat protein n=1 Tax=Streptomyces maoxianensis TaxID=1459942 RepID=A0ABV9G036_9ACTN